MARIDLGRVVDLASQLEADARVDPETLRRRDRTLGRELAGRLDDATERVEAWLDRRSAGSDASLGEQALRAQRVVRLLLALLGLALGAGASLALFAYDGSHPVNVLRVVGFFVALQLVLVALTLVLLLPDAWRRRLPGLAALQDVLALASPGRWQPALRRLLPAAQRAALDRAGGLVLRHQRLYGPAQKWLWLSASQLFAVCFHASALAAAAALVALSDLAFGWSTTLDIDAGWIQRGAALLAAPWAWALPEAVPDLELVQATRYFRGEGGIAVDPVRSAQWWRFLLACMASYALAPRLVLLGVAALRQRAALRRVFAELPGAAELRERLDTRWVSTAADAPEGPAPSGGPRAPAPRVPVPARVRAVRWSGVPVADERVAEIASGLGAELAGLHEGGAGSGVSDAELAAELARAGDAPLVLVKAWEPPLLELLDWLAELRQALGAATPILVLPLGADAQGRLAPARGPDARIWARRLDASGDPRLDVVRAPGEPL